MNRETETNRTPESELHNLEKQVVGQSMVIPVIEEQVKVGKQIVETGTVRISKQVHEETVPVNMQVVQEEVDVETVAVNQYVETPPPPVRYEGDTMIIPVLQEVVVVERRLLLVEEIRVTKRRTETQVSQQVTLRKEEIHVERDTPGNASPNPL